MIKQYFRKIDHITKSLFEFTAQGMSDNIDGRKNAGAHACMKKARWIVTVPRTKPLHSLERGAQIINEPSVIVSARIDHSLRLRSVEARFDSNRAEAFCKTCNFLNYQINLYVGDERGNSTLVEIVKLKGCGFSYINERDTVMNAAKGLGGAPSLRSLSLTIPPDLLSLYEPPSDTKIETTLDRTIDQLHSNYDSTVIFALQNLHSMTSEDKYYSETVDRVSTYIIKNHNSIRDMIASIYANRVSDVKDEKSEEICSLSLIILMNGIKSISSLGINSGRNSIVDQEDFKYFIEQLVPSLSVGIKNYRKNAHLACLATKCLCLLTMCSPFALTKMGDISEVVEGAQLYGSVEHLKLERAAFSLMKVLRSPNHSDGQTSMHKC